MRRLFTRRVALEAAGVAVLSALMGWIDNVPVKFWPLIFIGIVAVGLLDLVVRTRFGERTAFIGFVAVVLCCAIGAFLWFANSNNWFGVLVISIAGSLWCIARYIGLTPNSISSGRDISAIGADKRRST
jgi:hypothetical protein